MGTLLATMILTAAGFGMGGAAVSQEEGFVYEVTVKGMT